MGNPISIWLCWTVLHSWICIETRALGTYCTANKMMKSHWKPLAGFLLCPLNQCPFAPFPWDANIASIPWTDRHHLPMSIPLAHLPVGAKTSLLAVGTKEGKGLNLDEVINPCGQARLVKDNGRADCTSLNLAALLANLWRVYLCFLCAAQNAITGLRGMNVSGKD